MNFANVALAQKLQKHFGRVPQPKYQLRHYFAEHCQLKSLFKDDWEGIIGNCDTLLYLGGNEYGTYEYLSKILGKETERTKSQSIGKAAGDEQQRQPANRWP